MHSRTRSRVCALALACALTGTAAMAGAPASEAAGTTVEMLGQSLIADASTLRTSTLLQSPPTGTPTLASAVPLSSFPQVGRDYAILSTGDAGAAAAQNDSGNFGVDNHGGSIRGGALDAVVFRVEVEVPGKRNCAQVDFRFLSEEFPEYVGSSYNDAFVIEMDSSTWTVASNGAVDAPNNFAFDPSGSAITINAAGETSMSAADAAGTTYDGATPLLTAATRVTPGKHTFYFSIFDVGDASLDSAAFVDNLRFTEEADPQTTCVPGAKTSAENTAVPLIGAHGITGLPSDMNTTLERAAAMVPTLESTSSAVTGEISSVWTNGDQIVSDAVDLTAATGQPQVNVIAHSKGGLDSRVAMWREPQLFRSLGMLATPNAGSVGADTLCALRQVPWWLGGNLPVSNQGPCDGPDDGLYNLQTAYMREVFNQEVRDWPQHSKSVVAGNCATSDPACWFMASSLAHCSDLGLELDGVGPGNDGVVCVSSAFARTRVVRDTATGQVGGSDSALLPVFSLGHAEMKDSICPTAQVIERMYGGRNVANPWTDGSCRGNGTPPPGEGPVPTAARVSGDDTAFGTGAGSFRTLQKIDVLAVSAGATSTIDVKPEGSGGAQIELWSDSPVEVTVTDGSGADDEAIDVTGGELDGAQITSIQIDAADGAPRVLHVTSGTEQAVGVLTYVDAGEVRVDAVVEPIDSSRGTLRVTVSGVPAEDLALSSLTAWSATGAESTQTEMEPTSEPGVYQATVPLRAGVWTPVYAQIDGPTSRTVDTGILVEDGSARIIGAVGDELVDTDGDGTVDTLAVDVAVSTDTAGTFELAADFSTAEGVAFSAPAVANLEQGAGVLTLEAPIAALLAGGADGPYQLTNGVMTRTSESRVRVATATSLGAVGAHPAAELPVDQLGLYRPDLSQVGDRIVATASAAVITSGTYRVSGSLTGPDGAHVQLESRDLDLPAGVSVVDIGFGAVGLGSGVYSVNDLTLTSAVDPAQDFIAHPVSTEYLASDDPEPSVGPVLRSQRSVTLTNTFETSGPDGDVVTAADFSCNSSVHIAGDVVAAGDVTMTNDCQVDGDVRAGGSVLMNSNAKIGGDVTAVGDVSLQESVHVAGSVSSGGMITSIDSRSTAELQESGTIGGEVSEGMPIKPPSIPDRSPFGDPDPATWSEYTKLSWVQWMNDTAATNSAPSWSAGLTASPGCVMAPWSASVNGASVSVEDQTVIDARSATSGCDAVTMQGMTLELDSDLVVLADRLAFVNGLDITSRDGEGHQLTIIATAEDETCSARPVVSAPNGLQVAPEIDVMLVGGGKVQVNGMSTMAANLDVGCFEASGRVVLSSPSAG